MSVRFGLLVALSLGSLPAAAQDNTLQPDAAAVFGGSLYQALVGEVLDRGPALCRGGVQMLTLPSFRTEQSAGTCYKGGAFVAYAASPRTPLFYAGTDTTGVEPWSAERARTVEVERTEVRIDSATAARVADVWARALRTARQPADPDLAMLQIRGDGETMYFASFAPVVLTAHAWSPSPESISGALVALGNAIDGVAQGRAPVGVLAPACDRVERLLPAPAAP